MEKSPVPGNARESVKRVCIYATYTGKRCDARKRHKRGRGKCQWCVAVRRVQARAQRFLLCLCASESGARRDVQTPVPRQGQGCVVVCVVVGAGSGQGVRAVCVVKSAAGAHTSCVRARARSAAGAAGVCVRGKGGRARQRVTRNACRAMASAQRHVQCQARV